MRINWKLRLKNKVTLTAIIATVFLLIEQLGFELPKNISQVVDTALSLLVLLGVISDPTTQGIEDSTRALEYDKPI